MHGTNYVTNDSFLSLLAAAGASFYNEHIVDVGEDPQYEDGGDFSEQEDVDDEDGQNEDG